MSPLGKMKMNILQARKVLLLSADASHQDIKTRYRELSRKYHPDTSSEENAKEKFMEVNAAYKALTSHIRQSSIIRKRLTITLEEAFRGGEKILHQDICPTCQGTHKIKSPSPLSCLECMGKGYVLVSKGMMKSKSTCQHCQGSGIEIWENCPDCQDGDIPPSILIPRGIKEEEEITTDFNNVEIKWKIHINPHPKFKRQDDNLLTIMEIPYSKLCLGGNMEILTIDKNIITVTIPPETKSGKILVVSGQGMWCEDGRGDLLIRVMAGVPVMDGKMRRLLEKMAELGG